MNIEQILTNRLEENMKGRNHKLTLNDLPNPEEIPGMKKSVKRIIKNLKNGKKMRLVGDYDADGVFATTIVTLIMKRTKFFRQYDWVVPDRFIDGYGVSKTIIDKAIEDGIDFIVTVDNGIGAYEAIEYANENGIEVIITDHHTTGEKIPNAYAIVNLKYKPWNYPFIEISGATIAWYMCALLVEKLELEIDMRNYIDLVAITVISDVMPLKDINLIFFNYGIELIKNRHRKVYELIFDSLKNKTLDESDLGFLLVPMINAVGRIDHAKNAVNLFISDNMGDIKKGVNYLYSVNNKRKKLTDQLTELILPEAIKQVSEGHNSIIIKQENLHEGIVGILAGKIAEKFKKPTYVFGWNRAKSCWKGSGRTSGGINLYKLTKRGADYALGFGGHKGAVGVAIKESHFNEWKNLIQKSSLTISKSLFFEGDLKPLEIDFKDINIEIAEILNQYRPFGEQFPEVIFKTKCFINIQDSFKEGLHWKVRLSDNFGNKKEGWFFHDKNIFKYNNKEIDIYVKINKIFTKNGYDLELHCQIPFESMIE